MRVILHIGMHKTGTTSFQEWFGDHQVLARQNGFRFFSNPIQIMRFSDYYHPSWLVAEAQRAAKDGINALVFSAEAMSTFSKQDLVEIVGLFSDHPVEILICLRHWNGFLPSFWAACCNWGDAQSLPSFFRRLVDFGIERTTLHYPLVIQNAVDSGADKVSILSYNNAVSDGGLLPATLNAIGFPTTEIVFDGEERKNRRRASLHIEKVRLLNGIYHEKQGWVQNAKFELRVSGRSRETEQVLAGRFANQKKLQLGKTMRNYPDLIRELEDQIVHHLVKNWTADEGPMIQHWREAAEVAAAPFLLNASGGQLFDGAEVDERSYSSLDVYDLSEALKASLYNAMIADARI
ncbi:MAG: hypothetical protein AAFV54_01030 [Pseudomonadota bacterium]